MAQRESAYRIFWVHDYVKKGVRTGMHNPPTSVDEGCLGPWFFGGMFRSRRRLGSLVIRICHARNLGDHE